MCQTATHTSGLSQSNQNPGSWLLAQTIYRNRTRLQGNTIRLKRAADKSPMTFALSHYSGGRRSFSADMESFSLTEGVCA